MPSRLFSNRDLVVLFLPLIIEQTLKYSLGLVDSMMVASVGEAAVSGVSLMDFVLSFITSLFASLLVGGSAIISQYIGAQNPLKANFAANQLVRLTGIFSLCLCGLVYSIKPFILNRLFGPLAQEVSTHADTYICITASSIPFFALYCTGANLFRCMGNTGLPMKIMFVCQILNILGNAVLVFLFDMGTAGVALSTLFSRIVAAFWILGLLFSKKRILFLSRPFRMQFDPKIIQQILRIGVPYCFENGTFFFGRILVLGMVASLGTTAIASNAVAGTLSNMQVIPGMAIAFGTTVVIAQCAGSGDFEQVKFYNRKIIGIVYYSQLVVCTLIFLLLPKMMSIYGLSSETTRQVEAIMLVHTLFTVLVWPLSFILPTTFRATGDARYPMVISLLSLVVGRFACSWIFGIYLQMGITGIWLGMFADWCIKATCFVIYYRKGKWMTWGIKQSVI